MAQQNIRTYEISVWTLQDDFITMLKPTFTENKGQVQDAKMQLNVDGTQTLKFRIPIYIYENGTRVENPIWYTTQEGVLVENLRKIKVIFNKATSDEAVFEFLINKVTDEHVRDELYCNVECEGLAFNELGKIGYKISLSSEDFYKAYEEWFSDENHEGDEPIANIEYWLKQFMQPSTSSSAEWHYEIDMDWGSYSEARSSDKIYDDTYVGSWIINDGNITPNDIVDYQEKARLIDIEESNIYNITQQLAEVFGVFCRYEYEHDATYHITGRKVIFYNHFFYEDEGYIDLTYPYSTDSIKREIDSADLITKMFVKPVETTESDSGLVTIMNVPANKSQEDYVMNFDYLHDIGTISDEQYAKIEPYEVQMNEFNNQLIVLENQIIDLNTKITPVKAQITLSENAIRLDTERLSSANSLLNNLVNDEGVIEVTVNNPDSAVLLEDKNDTVNHSYYINLSRKGIDSGSVKIYRTYEIELNQITQQYERKLLDELKTGIFVEDEFGELVKITNLYKIGTESRVYLTYKYEPRLYYEKVVQVWTKRLAKDQADLANAQKILYGDNNQKGLMQILEETQTQYNTLLTDKQNAIKAFEHMMGPALREGYWLPDDFNDYGDHYADWWTNIVASSTSTGTQNTDMDYFLWDTEPFFDEQLSYYYLGTNTEVTNYPCVLLPDGILSNDISINDARLKQLCFLFYDYTATNYNTEPVRKMRSYVLGSECKLGFTVRSGQVKPILILTGVESLPANMSTAYRNGANIGALETVSVDNQQTVQLTSWSQTVSNNDFLTGTITLVYPRIVIKSMALKKLDNQLSIGYNQYPLKQYEDYYITSRIIENNTLPCYFITFKPEALLRQGGLNKSLSISYIISNADISIYLDALKIIKENAYPKVSYNIDTNIVDSRFMHKAYNMLSHLVNINDVDLKFKNVRGYISEAELNLEQPWLDEFKIKNYKNKFEDLFSSIVAQTSEMKKNSGIIDMAASSFTSNGEIDPDLFQNSLRKIDLNYAFNHGKLTIDEENGIWGTSEAGVVAFRGGGIFTATNKDRAGNWIWNTGIVPQGINADLITTGQLDTNRIMVYAGDKLRFQLNGDGLFAYKSFFEDINELDLTQVNFIGDTVDIINDALARGKEVDGAQFIKMDANGLFFIIKEGALVLNKDKTDYIEIDGTIRDPFGYDNKVTFVPNGSLTAVQAYNEHGVPYHDSNDIEDDDVWIYDETYTLVKYEKAEGETIQYDQTAYGTFTVPSEGIQRVSITWDGLTLRNYNNEKVFYADPDTGNLEIKGRLIADSVYIVKANGDTEAIDTWVDTSFEDHVKVSENLEDILDKAGEILVAAGSSLKDIRDINMNNFDILRSFYEDTKTKLTPKVAKGPYHNVKFKPGDIWIKTAIVSGRQSNLDSDYNPKPDSENPYINDTELGTYTAIAYWDEVYNSEAAAISGAGATSGWTRTHDYSLAAITGAKLNVDAEAGTISLEAQNQIDIKSGSGIYIGANENVEIVGNKKVNIGGTTINIASSDTTESHLGGIHLIATKYQDVSKPVNQQAHLTDDENNTLASISKVDIDANGIILESKNGINLKSGAGISIKSSSNSNVAVISLDKNKGIWLGSTQKISLFSATGDVESKNASGASIEISPTRIIFGLSDLSSSQNSVVDLTQDYIILGVGEQIDDLEGSSINWITSTISGVKITKDGIWLASGAGTQASPRSLIALQPGELTIGVANNNNTGSFIKLSQTEMKIGASTDIYIGAANIILDSKGTTNTTPINNVNKNTYFRLGPANNWGLVFDGTDLHVKGNIYANGTKVVRTAAGSGETGDYAKLEVDWEKYFLGNDDDNNNHKILANTVAAGLKTAFETAGDVITKATNSIDAVTTEAATNKAILSGFIEKAKALTARTMRGPYHAAKFKMGDVWQKTEVNGTSTNLDTNGELKPDSTNPYINSIIIATYVATAYWNEVYSSETVAKQTASVSSSSGWTRTSDTHSLAAITGASIDIDAVAGTIDINAQSKITLRAKSQLDLLSNDIIITGNYSIDIGSKWINIGSTNGGINIVSTDIDANTTTGSDGKVNTTGTISKVLISRAGITMHSNDIELMAGDTDNAAALLLTHDKGIWIGSSKEIRLFSGNTTSSSDGKSANVLISKDRILMGVNSTTSSTVTDLTNEYILFAAGGTATSSYSAGEGGANAVATAGENSNNLTNSNTEVSGLYIAKEKILMASGTSNTSSGRGFFFLTPGKIQLGTSNNGNTGSIIEMDNGKVTIGVQGTTSINQSDLSTSNLSNAISGLLIQKNSIYLSATQGSSNSKVHSYIGLDINGIRLTTNKISGSSILTLDSDKIFFGINNSTSGRSNTGAVEITKDKIIMGVETTIGALENADPTTSVSGVKITKDDILFATSSNSIYITSSGISMTGGSLTFTALGTVTPSLAIDADSIALNGGVLAMNSSVISLIGSGISLTAAAEGSTTGIEITPTVLQINSNSNLKVNTNNVAIFSGGTAETMAYPSSTASEQKTFLRLGPKNAWGLLFDGANLWIKGNLYAAHTYVIDSNGVKTSFDDYLDNLFEKGSEVQERISNAFSEAADILVAARQSLTDVNDLISTHSAYLDAFYNKVADKYVPKTTEASTHPAFFKEGDIWKKTENGTVVATYMAVSNWDEVYASKAAAQAATALSSSKGWNKIYEGRFANIVGANIDVDADAGIINLSAASSLNLASSTLNLTGTSEINIYTGGKMSLTGNAGIDIGGTGLIALASASGIKMFVSSSTTITSFKLDASGIELGSGSIINITSANNANVSEIELSPSTGIRLRTNQAITLFSGAIGASGGAAVEITKDRIMFGVSNTTSSTTALEMTKDYIIAAAGDSVSSLENNDIALTGTLTGIKITKDSFGLATVSSNIRNVVLVNSSGIKIASGTNNTNLENSGSIITISPTELYLGSSANLEVNTNNVKINSGVANPTGTNEATVFGLGTNLNSTAQYGLKFYKKSDGNAYLRIVGEIEATAFRLSSSASMPTQITLYYAKTSSGSAPTQPSSVVTDSTGGTNKWTTKPASYNSTYTYYTCEQYCSGAGTQADPYIYSWSTYIENADVKARQKAIYDASQAGGAADDMWLAVAPNNFSNGLYTNYTTNNTTYGVALTGSKNMLIGSGSQLDVRSTSINIYGSSTDGINLFGGEIYITSSSRLRIMNGSTAAVYMDDSGIQMTGSNITMTSGGNLMLTGGTVSITGSNGGSISFTDSNNETLFSVTNGGTMICKELQVTGALTVLGSINGTYSTTQTTVWEGNYNTISGGYYTFTWTGNAVSSGNHSATVTVNWKNTSSLGRKMYYELYYGSTSLKGSSASNVYVDSYGYASVSYSFTYDAATYSTSPDTNLKIKLYGMYSGSYSSLTTASYLSDAEQPQIRMVLQ